ncbi:zinc ABC transporter substrate-binding protein [Heyndrickxia sporothermodurans]|uniref:metal ABC transporter solute-binding protein, Zn/Mn family n=1 Tax=Heyndrickxia sporothermodurans TaxID=46224 RepID=UPI002E24AAB9|nr:zinc ABC transporter substrate-binding protein [Heyndrickxia sporothermodurans]MED3655908.1 zinc ABC transporter substrate-binding protein [Heyndrickxia sporothermodurans]
MKKTKMFFLGLSIVVFLLSACTKASKDSKPIDGKIKVTTTIGMIKDIVDHVGGNYVKTIGLMKSGVDPHLYKASQGDIKKLEDADMIFYNGLHLEGKMVDIFEKLAKKKATVPVSKNIPETDLRTWDDGTEGHDPHIWFNVKHWITATETVRDALIKFDSKHKENYVNNADEYIEKLKELDQYTTEKIASIPKESRVLVTAHDAFGYFGDAYEIKVMGLQGISTASEYGAKDVSQLRDFLVDNKIKAVFVESSVPKKAINAVVEGAKKKGHEVKIGGELYSDAMGKEGTDEGTYIGMVKHNVDTIVNALK